VRAFIYRTYIFLGALLAATLLVSTPSRAQPIIPEVEAEPTSAAVTLDGRILFRVAGLGSYSAEQRAQAITGRIEAAAADMSVSAEALRVNESPDWSSISAGNRVLMAVTDADASSEGIDRKTLVERRRARIIQALDTYRSERSAGVLLRATLSSVGTALALWVVLVAGSRLFRRFHAAAERNFRAKIQATPFPPLHFIQADRSWKTLSTILHFLRTAGMLVLVFFSLTFVLGQFPGTRHTSAQLFTILLGPLRTMGKAVVESLPSLFFLLILLLVTRYVLTVIRLFFQATENRTITFANFDHDWSMPTYRIMRVLVIAFALVVAYPYMPGSETAAFKGVSVFLGIVFSLSSSSALANVIAGYTLIYRRAYKVGDRVRIGDAYGDVVQIGQQATYVRSLKNEELIIPNSEILKTSVVNYSSLSTKPGLIITRQ
jgi:small-conductance mechanosensitive channel